MVLPLQITFRNMDHSDLVEKWIRKEAAKLETFYRRIISCRIALERPNRRHKWGSLYHVRIDLAVPGGELVVKHQPTLHTAMQHIGNRKLAKHLEIRIPHKDLRQAINDAFKAAGRRLQDYARRQRGATKIHASAPQARVSRLFPDKGYGFLETPDAREIYFHRNSVLGGAFKRLRVGTPVRFAEEQGENGPQASTVRLHPSQASADQEPAALAIQRT